MPIEIYSPIHILPKKIPLVLKVHLAQGCFEKIKKSVSEKLIATKLTLSNI